MRRRCWPEQILRWRWWKRRSNAAAARRRSRRYTIRSCSARLMLSPRSRFIKNASVSPLEERLGYKFRNSLLLAEALTHPSIGHETQRHHFDNQRLEFLGDAVLQLIFTRHLFDLFPNSSEGELTKLRSRLVSREGLKVHALKLGLGEFLMMGKGEESSGGRSRVSTLADAFE